MKVTLLNVLCEDAWMGEFTKCVVWIYEYIVYNVLCGVVQGCESLLYCNVKCCLCRDARMGKIISSYCVVQDQERLYYSMCCVGI